MSITQNRDAIARLKGIIADLMKQQSRERESHTKILSKIADIQKKITTASKTTSVSTIQGYHNQLVQPLKESAKYEGKIADLEKKIAEKTKEIHRYQEALDKELKNESQKQDVEIKKQQKQQKDYHRQQVARLREINDEINRQNSLRSSWPNTTHSFHQEQRQELIKADPMEGTFTVAEIIQLNQKIDLVMDALEKLGYGQEIIFNEIDEMRSLMTMNKKTWLQTLKGKLFELVVEKTLDVTLVPKIIEALSSDAPIFLN